MSLTRPAREKMSKSSTNEKSRILITDSLEDIQRKIKAAVTDSEARVTYDPVKRPEISNLIDIVYYMLDDETLSRETLVKDVQSKSAFKAMMADIINEKLAPIRDSYLELMVAERGHRLREIADEGAMKARERAESTMSRVREVVGLS
jgi:tryptophanyl-tRNA synthetase